MSNHNWAQFITSQKLTTFAGEVHTKETDVKVLLTRIKESDEVCEEYNAIVRDVLQCQM